MRTTCLALAVVAAMLTPGLAADITLQVENVIVGKHGITAVVRIDNAGPPLRSVGVPCAFLNDAGTAVDTGADAAFNLSTGPHAFVKPGVMRQEGMVTTTECSVLYLDPPPPGTR